MNTTSIEPWLANALECVLSGEPVENISISQPNISLTEAYDVQRELVAQIAASERWGHISGYKAALTAEAAQHAMGIDEPIVGVLFTQAAYQAEPATAVTTDRPVLLETELGFTLGKSITEPVHCDTVLDAISMCRGMIELAAPNLQQPPTGIDLVASNSATYGSIAGASSLQPHEADLDAMAVSLVRRVSATGDDELHSAMAGSVMGGQQQALVWLINKVLDLGYRLEPGHVLMTGSVGSIHSGKAGNYQANFAQLGRLSFQLA